MHLVPPPKLRRQSKRLPESCAWSVRVVGACRIELGDHGFHKLARLDDSRMRSPFEDPRHDGREVGAGERDEQRTIGLVLQRLSPMPFARSRVRSALLAELDHDAPSVLGIAAVEIERALKLVVEPEVDGHDERVRAERLGLVKRSAA